MMHGQKKHQIVFFSLSQQPISILDLLTAEVTLPHTFKHTHPVGLI